MPESLHSLDEGPVLPVSVNHAGVEKELHLALEEHLAAVDSGHRKVRQLVLALTRSIEAHLYDQAIGTLQRAVVSSLDYTSAQSLYRIYRQLEPHWAKPTAKTRIAILSNQTVVQFSQFLELFLFSAGIGSRCYVPDFGVLQQEIFDPGSGLHDFSPNILFLASSWRDLVHLPQAGDDKQKVNELVEAELSYWRLLWQTAQQRFGGQIIQNNFDSPPWRHFGNFETRHFSSIGRFIGCVNDAFAELAPPHVVIHDIDHLSNIAGLWNWGDQRFFHHAKLPCAPEFLVDYAHSAASLAAAQLGRAKKCLVLDLDNTLWGGVIGDEGIGQIRLGAGNAEGEAYVAFQRYIKGLKTRGVILAVCSKNEDHVAREVFEKHPEMVLRTDDISCFVANWTDKASNLRNIAKQLNIGLDSMVFVDDNPAERSIVRQLVPEVCVPELPEDVTGYIRALERHRFFQVVAVNTEDLRRTEMYRANLEREQAGSSADSLDAFLRSLDMRAVIGPVNSTTVERTAQLIARSNQFNLTTRRYSNGEVQAIAEDPDWLTCTVSLFDRFGNNGLISVLLAKVQHDVLLIDTWLMSCRVLKRGVEDFLLASLVKTARSRGLRVIRGEFIPTTKNDLVRQHYGRLGFSLISEDCDGHTYWELAVESWTGRNCFIQEIEVNGQSV
jgi:FkbH-like protein